MPLFSAAADIHGSDEWLAVALDDGLQGYIMGNFRRHPYAKIETLFVQPEQRHKGIGSELLKRFEREAQTRKCVTVHFTLHLNSTLEEWYAERGYLGMYRHDSGQVELSKSIRYIPLLDITDTDMSRDIDGRGIGYCGIYDRGGQFVTWHDTLENTLQSIRNDDNDPPRSWRPEAFNEVTQFVTTTFTEMSGNDGKTPGT